MPNDTRVDELLKALLDSGGTPEEVCRTCPELLTPVRARWRQLRALQADVSALFPMFPSDDCANPNDVRPHSQPTAELPLIPGYEVQELLGRGGMGVVYKAWHVRLQRSVAVKMLLAGNFAQPQELERFLREAETVAGLRHPNIVQVHEAGDVDGRPYFTMEFIEGGTLAQKLAGTPQPARQAASLVATVAEAVNAAHQRGVVHRDLKPGNILLTADGTPKLSDFGLARRLEGTAGLTQSGDLVGTPSYMAPEQAEGKSRDVGPAADNYALGAILYELLTGRPPFRAETAAETLRQVISQEPVPPSRLNAAVPRDPETICLKCLEKDPQRRYASAAVLAEDLQRFLRNEPIVARPVGPFERTLRWTRRNPTVAALAATALALIGLASGGGVWFAQQRAERGAELRTQVESAMAQAVSFSRQLHFPEARKLLEQARQRLEPAGPDDLRGQVKQVWTDLELAEDLDRARLRAATPVEGKLDPAGAELLYEETFTKAGLSQQGDNSDEVAARVRNSGVCAEIVAAMDDWASTTPDHARFPWLLAVARKADPDPLRDRLRQPKLWRKGPELAKLVQDLRVEDLSPQLATALGRRLPKTHGEAVSLLSAAQAHHPQDFWLNYELGLALYQSGRRDEALGYYRAALALRPKASLVHNALGMTLDALGRFDEAILHYEESVQIDPKASGLPHNNLGIAWQAKGQMNKAIFHYEESIRIDPKASAVAHNDLGTALREQGRLDEAMVHFQESFQIDPKMAGAHNNLGVALKDKGRLDEAISHFKEAFRIDPKSAGAHHNLGGALRDKGRPDEAISHYQEAIRIDPNMATAHHGLALALRDKGRSDEAISYFQESIRLDPKASVTARYNLGITLRDKSRLDEAISYFQECVRVQPESPAAHHMLGRTLRDKNRLEEAIRHFQQAAQLDPTSVSARNELYMCRYSAACAALRGSAGQSAQKAPTTVQAHTDRRRQALDWLRANLELRSKLLEETNVLDLQTLTGWSLSAWQTEPALASVRDRVALTNLPDAEREQWQRFWVDVTAQLAVDPVEQGMAHAARRAWAKAAESYSRALASGTTDAGHFWFEYAAVLHLSGDREGYKNACAHMVERFGKAPGLRAYHVARACTLAAGAVAEASLPSRLAEAELKAATKDFWSLTEQGALQFRAGHFEEAVSLFEQSLRADPKPGRAVVNWLWLALANQGLGKSEEAKRWLEKATEWLDKFGDGMPPRAEDELGLHLHNWLEAHVLRREAEEMIRPTAGRAAP